MYSNPVLRLGQMTGLISAILIVPIWLIPGIKPVVAPVQALCTLISLVCIACFVVGRVRQMLRG